MTHMLFHRDRPKKLNFEDYLKRAQDAGFETASVSLSGGKYRVSQTESRP